MEYLLEAGLDEKTAEALFSELRRQNPFAGCAPTQFVIEDASKGRLRLPAKAMKHYRTLFASVGVDISSCLTSRKALAEAWRDVCRRRRERLLEEDLAASTGIRRELAEAMARRDFDEANRILSVMEKRAAFRQINS